MIAVVEKEERKPHKRKRRAHKQCIMKLLKGT